jgi:PAS domain S-box-containing protein
MAVASLSAGLSLLLLQGHASADDRALFIQGNLLSQCAVALLAASSFGWVRINEHRYRQVAASLPIVFYSARFFRPARPPVSASDRDAEVTRVSAASEALIGCPPRELLGEIERWMSHIHPEDRELLRAAIAQVGRYGQSVSCEYRITPPVRENRNPNSEIRKETEISDVGFRVSDFARQRQDVRWVHDTLAPQWDSEGRLLGWEGVLTDITEQRTLADDLRRTTNMLHALVDNLPTGVFFVQGPSGHSVLVNTRARQLLGQREDMAAGLEHLSEVYRLHRPDGTPYPVEELPVFLALRKGLTAMRDDIVVHRPDGRRTPLVTWAAPIHYPLSAGRPPLAPADPAENGKWVAESGWEAAVWVLEDLTALHQAEAARRDTEVRLRAILETMSEGVVVQDRGGCVIDSNAAASVILGQTPEKLRGKKLTDCDWRLMREDGTLLAEEEYPAAVVSRLGRPVRNLVLAIVPRLSQSASPDQQFKEVRWVLINVMPLGAASTGEQPTAKGVVSTYIDITPTIRAQRMLRDSEEKYRDLVESLPLMVIQADMDLRVTYANSATRRLSGYEQNEITEPAMWGRLVHPDDLPKLLTMGHEALSGRGSRSEYRYRAKDGSDKVGLAFSEPRRRSDGTIIGTTTLIADITRERQLEQELFRAQRLELVGRLAGGIAHDFNNLLSVILSMADLARATLPPGHSSRDDLQRIEEATQQAANLANQLLTFSKQRRIATRRIDINDTVARTLDLLRASLPSRIELKAELAPNELLVRADETQVQQVVMNLCLNARDAMPRGGLLEVRTALALADGKWICLSVRDNGTGMTDEVKAHLFDPFFSTKERGTGLGLAVVRHIVECHGGRVEVASESGKGARFDVWWPTCREGESNSVNLACS